jgi:hypothetical protein
MRAIFAAVVLAAITAMASEPSTHDHSAPHGGVLVELGNELAHLEVRLDGGGKLLLWVLDGEAEGGVPLEVGAIGATARLDRGQAISLRFEAVPNVLTGETAARSSHFVARAPALEDEDRVLLDFDPIEIRGVRFDGITAALSRHASRSADRAETSR